MDLDLQFRPLKAALSAKALDAYRKDGGLSGPPPDKMAKNVRGKLQWVSVEHNKKQIGIARLELAPPEFCYVSELVINSKYRGQGIGHWFMTRIEQYCLGLGIRRLLLEAGDGTDSFYKSQAFVADPLVPQMLKKEINPFQRKLFIPLHN